MDHPDLLLITTDQQRCDVQGIRHPQLLRTRLSALGRLHSVRGQEKRYCYGVSMGPDGGEFGKIFRGFDKSFAGGPFDGGQERLTKDEALAALRTHEQEGLCHTVWTFRTPFIAGVCNCDRADCLAMRCTVTHDLPMMFRPEYVAQVDPDKCTGCRSCMRSCQFGATGYIVPQRTRSSSTRGGAAAAGYAARHARPARSGSRTAAKFPSRRDYGSDLEMRVRLRRLGSQADFSGAGVAPAPQPVRLAARLRRPEYHE